MSTDFSSIDRLVEFGMGLTLAQQMVSTMNHAMNNMQIPGVNAGTTGQAGFAAAQVKTQQWYTVVENRQVGPLTEAEMTKLVTNGSVTENSLVWHPGMPGWQMACDVSEINKIFLLNR